MLQHTCSEAGLNLIRKFEGLRLHAYQDQVGVWTIGYGHTGHDVHAGLTITREQAEEFLLLDVDGAAAFVKKLVTSSISQNQFDALVDFVFNLGCGSLAQSTLLRMVNDGDLAGAAGQFERWDHAGGVVNAGLRERRLAEAKLFAGNKESRAA